MRCVCIYMVYKYTVVLAARTSEGSPEYMKNRNPETRDLSVGSTPIHHDQGMQMREEEGKHGTWTRRLDIIISGWIIKPSRPVPFRSSTSAVSRSAARSPHPRGVAWPGNSLHQTTRPLFVDWWGVESENLRRNRSRSLNLLLRS